ncbi:MAG TPA: PAS domain-containing protein, partial [Chitinophagaceae bacterium]
RSRDQVIGKHVLEIFPQYKTGTVYQHCVKALDGEITHVPPDEKLGLAGYHESYFIPLKNEVKETTGILWIIHDLSERFIAEKAFSKQQELLRQAEKIAHLGSWELEVETDRLYWSDGIFTIYGYAPQVFEPTMEFYLETTHPEDREELMSAVSRAKTGYIPKALNCRIYTVDGQMRHISTMIRPVIDEDGNVSRLIAAIQDNTDQKIMQDELIRKTSAIRLQYHMDRQSEKIRNFASWQWNISTGKMIWGEHFFRILGIEPFSFDPTIEAFSGLMVEEDGDKFRELCKQIASDLSGKPIQYEFRLTTNGKTKYLRLSGRIISASHAIGTVIDITEDNLLRKQLAVRIQAIENLNRSLEDKNRKLEEINEELTSFAFVASHDLREPLRKIQVFSDWLCNNESERLTADGLDRFKRIQAAVHRMDVLIDDILRYSRVNTPFSGFMKLDIDAILKNVKSDLAETIESTKTIIESDPLPVVTGNETQLSQLFMNILSNAIKYQAPGNIPHIRISSAIIQGTSIDHPAAFHALNYVKISFADNGIGFDEQYSRKIFQMFQRLHGMSEYPGTGMGLAICKKIAEHHRGFIVASSKPGQGSVFDFYVPDTANE